jgi:hypothetical protein
MAYEERRVVTDTTEPAVVEDGVPANRVVEEDVPASGVVGERVVREPAVEPTTVVRQRTPTRIVQTDDPIGNVYAASQLIQTIVWSVVIIVLLVVLLLALHVYAHLF